MVRTQRHVSPDQVAQRSLRAEQATNERVDGTGRDRGTAPVKAEVLILEALDQEVAELTERSDHHSVDLPRPVVTERPPSRRRRAATLWMTDVYC